MSNRFAQILLRPSRCVTLIAVASAAFAATASATGCQSSSQATSPERAPLISAAHEDEITAYQPGALVRSADGPESSPAAGSREGNLQ